MDIATSLFIWAIQSMTLAGLLLVLWLHQRHLRSHLTWSCGFALLGIGLGLLGLRGHVPDFLSIEIANSARLLFIGLLVGGLQQFDGKPVRPFIIVPVLIWIGGLLIPAVREDFIARVILFHIASSAGYCTLIGLLTTGTENTFDARRALAWLLSILVIGGIALSVAAMVGAAMSIAQIPLPGLFMLLNGLCFIGGVLLGCRMLNDRSEQQLKRLAVTDPLTGILNRRGLIEKFETLRATVSADKPLIALLHFDIDNFKQVNDRCGHQAGDTILIAFARLASISLAQRGFLGRMGGEEFASILRVSDPIEAASIAEGLRMTLSRQTSNVNGHRVIVTVSTGIALQPAEDADLDGLLSAADRALYLAKQSGRNRTALDRDGTPSIIPSADMPSREEMDLELGADEQVNALRRVTAIASG